MAIIAYIEWCNSGDDVKETGDVYLYREFLKWCHNEARRFA